MHYYLHLCHFLEHGLLLPAGWIIDNLSWDKFFNFFGIYLIQNSSWIGFFIVTALFSIPAIILLNFIQDKRGIIWL